ncbi:hypothetical protein ACU8KH_02202 [Lachancea thermotolerans]
MQDAVSVEMMGTDLDQTLSEHFTEAEQFWLYARDQDYDLDTCLELCDHVQLLNEDILTNNVEQRPEIVRAELDFAKFESREKSGSVDYQTA